MWSNVIIRQTLCLSHRRSDRLPPWQNPQPPHQVLTPVLAATGQNQAGNFLKTRTDQYCCPYQTHVQQRKSLWPRRVFQGEEGGKGCWSSVDSFMFCDLWHDKLSQHSFMFCDLWHDKLSQHSFMFCDLWHDKLSQHSFMFCDLWHDKLSQHSILPVCFVFCETSLVMLWMSVFT